MPSASARAKQHHHNATATSTLGLTHLSLGESTGQLRGARRGSPEAVDIGRGDAPGRFYAPLRRRDLGEAPGLAILQRQGPRELVPGWGVLPSSKYIMVCNSPSV